jgi:hypothetical protein
MDYNNSDGEIPEVDLSIRIQPYIFEPVRQNNTTQRKEMLHQTRTMSVKVTS